MESTSPSLLDRVVNGNDDAAWGRFVEIYSPVLLHWCKRLNLSDADAADLTQNVFVILYEQLPHFRYDADRSFRAWLKTILMNAWRNLLRRRQNESLGDNPGSPDLILESDPRVAIDDEEHRQFLVQQALRVMQSEFEPKTWKACWEFVFCDRSAAEVAKELEMTENAVYLAKSRVLRVLRQELKCFLD